MIGIAIILVNYKGYKDTLECIKSIKKSTFTNYEIIVVENASGEKDLFCKDTFINQHSTVLFAEHNGGFSSGNNIGIRYALEQFNPEYILLLNNDTEVKEDTLEKLYNRAQNTNNLGILTGKIYYFFNKKMLWAAQGKFNFKTGLADQPLMGKMDSDEANQFSKISFASGCLMLIPSHILKSVGLLDESFFMYAEDTDYCCRVMKAGFGIYYDPNAVIYHKVSASAGHNSISQQYYMFRNNCYIVQKYCDKTWYGYLRRIYRSLKDVIKGEVKFNVILKAWIDFRKGIIGKVEKFTV